MNKRIKNRWIKALRSGEYVQGTDALVTATDAGYDKFCCLGVLCDVLGLEFVARKDPDYPLLLAGTRQAGNLPRKMRDELGINRSQHMELIDMNDRLRYNFEEIADWISKNL